MIAIGSLAFSCPRCHRQLRTKAELAGKPVRCPNRSCNEVIVVPAVCRAIWRGVGGGAAVAAAAGVLVITFAFLIGLRAGTGEPAAAAGPVHPQAPAVAPRKELPKPAPIARKEPEKPPVQPAAIPAPAELPKSKPVEAPRDPKREFPDLTKLVPVKGDFTTAVLRSHADHGNPGLMAYPGSALWVEVSDQGEGQPSAARLLLDEPQSLWFIAEGGITEGGWKRSAKALKPVIGDLVFGPSLLQKGTFLPESAKSVAPPKLSAGKVYVIDDDKEPRLAKEGAYSVWIALDREQTIHERDDPAVGVIRRVPAREKVQLLSAGKDPEGWHRVRTNGPKGVEGWLRGEGWVETVFMRTGQADPAPAKE